MATTTATNRKKVTTSLSLPTRPNEVPDSLSAYHIMIFGRKGSGKTTLLANMPKALVFMFEFGRRNLAINQVPPNAPEGEEQLRLTWPNFLEYRDLFIESDKYTTAVIDTHDRCYEACFKYVCSELGIKHPNDLEYGKAWDAIKTEFEASLLAMIEAPGKSVAFISHAKVREYKSFDGSTYERVEPTASPSSQGIINTTCDFIFMLDFVEGHRVLTIRDHSNMTLTACGVEGNVFLDPAGVPLNRIQLTDNPKEGWQTLVDAFDNKLWDFDRGEPVRRRAKSLPRKKRKKSI